MVRCLPDPWRLEILLERFFGALPDDKVERSFDAFFGQRIHDRHSAPVNDLVHCRAIDLLPQPQSHGRDVLASDVAMIKSEQPKGETEWAIVVQMACIHSATMAVLGRLSGAYGDRGVSAAATAVSRLSRAFSTLVETLRRLRNSGSQVIRIERVEVREGVQAVIGNIERGEGR